jgi:ATP-dependent RNA helicase DDX49/DBP8
LLTVFLLRRELALQIADQFRAFGAPIHLKVACIVGGESTFILFTYFLIFNFCFEFVTIMAFLYILFFILDLLQQNQELDKHPHIVISTPGRLMGIIESSPTFHFKHMKFLVTILPFYFPSLALFPSFSSPSFPPSHNI